MLAGTRVFPSLEVAVVGLGKRTGRADLSGSERKGSIQRWHGTQSGQSVSQSVGFSPAPRP